MWEIGEKRENTSEYSERVSLTIEIYSPCQLANPGAIPLAILIGSCAGEQTQTGRGKDVTQKVSKQR